MTTTFPDFPAEYLSASNDPTVNALAPIIQQKWDDARAAADGLGVVREAEGNAVKELDTSDNDAAVKYRSTLDRKVKAEEKVNGEMNARIEAIKAEYADKLKTLAEIDSTVSEQRKAAIAELMQAATANIDTATLSKNYETSVQTLKGLVGAVVAVDPEAADKFKLPTVTQVIRGGRSSKDGERAGWRPRYTRITVDGVEVPGAENAKTGKVGNPTFTQAAKLAKVSSGLLLSELNDSMGNTFSWDSVTLAEDGSYTFTTAKVNNTPGRTIQVWPQLKADSNEDEQDNDSE